jgi:hypothetical protein
MLYLRYLCVFAYSAVQRILCCVVVFLFRFVYPMLPVSRDCPFVIAPSVFSNVYLHCQRTSIVILNDCYSQTHE